MTKLTAFEQALHMLQTLLSIQSDAPGAPPQIIERLEDLLNMDLPHELKEILLHVDGGIAGNEPADQYMFLPCALILDEWHARKEAAASAAADFGPGPHFKAAKGIKSVIWSDKWIPFCKQKEKVFCIDLDPEYGGIMGQIIEIDWLRGQVRYAARDITSFLDKVLKPLTAQIMELSGNPAAPLLESNASLDSPSSSA